MIETSQFKRGVCIVFKGAPMMITHMTLTTPTARGSITISKTKLRNLITGQVLNESIRSGEKFEEVDLEHHDASYMYSDGSSWYFMDDQTFEQFDLSKDELTGIWGYLVDGIEGIQAMLIDGNVISIQLPMTVDMAVTETEPAIKGATAQAQLKPATTETGMVVQVPSYLTPEDRIRVDTRDGHFIERVK
ncbi:MAG: elongation factor P [Chlamydiales bacterium]|jgi:elongation factor P